MRVLASYLLSIYIPTAQATSAIVNPYQNSYDNSLSVLPSASPIPRFYLSTEGVPASTKRSGRYSGLAQLFYRPSSLILLLYTILFTSLLFSSLTPTCQIPSPSKNSFLIFLTTFPRLLPDGSLESQRLSMQLLHTAIS